jgi:hypothetical protein
MRYFNIHKRNIGLAHVQCILSADHSWNKLTNKYEPKIIPVSKSACSCVNASPEFNVCHPEVFNTYINTQWCISQTQQTFIMFIIVSMLSKDLHLRRAWRWFYKNRNMLPNTIINIIKFSFVSLVHDCIFIYASPEVFRTAEVLRIRVFWDVTLSVWFPTFQRGMWLKYLQDLRGPKR